MKKIFGILANPAKHSLSPTIHNSAFRSLNLDAEYFVFEKEENEVVEVIDLMRNGKIEGLSVSIPYKRKMMEYLDIIDEDAKRIGAVNTIVRAKNGLLLGYNSDWIGSNTALGEESINGKAVVILGAGGAARAVAYGCLKAGGNVWIKNRDKSKADRIAIEFAEMFKTEIHSSDLQELNHGDILINTVPIKLEQYCNVDYLSHYNTVMDIVYKPIVTPLLEMADEAGCRIVTGEKMLLYQAVVQFELWNGVKAPVKVMQKALEESIMP